MVRRDNKKENRIIIRYLSGCICMIFSLVLLAGIRVHAETELPIDVYVTIDDNVPGVVHGLYVGYDYNKYLSLRDMKKAFADTAKSYELTFEDGKVIIDTTSEVDPEEDNESEDTQTNGWSQSEKEGFVNKALAMNELILNEDKKRYYTIVTKTGDKSDCYIQLTDFCMLFDVSASTDGEIIHFDTSNNMSPISPIELEKDGYFQGVNSVLVGDATTGELFYGYKEDEVFPIASTTKLMTYLLVAEALENGSLTENTMIKASEEAVALSQTSDGIIPLKLGKEYKASELIQAALIVSSNECDHMLSEYVCGSEEESVLRMNEKAIELGMSTAEFYNCNGLPVYTQTLAPAKKQNRMSSRDMFTLASYILNHYPEIKEVTSTKEITPEGIDKELKNTNPLLYNMKETTGLKTGTTNRSGACLVSSILVNDGQTDHDIVVVLLGAEGSPDRGRVSELLARYGKAVVLGEAMAVSASGEEEEMSPGVSANAILNMIVNRAMQIK